MSHAGDRYIPMTYFESLEEARKTLREASLLALEKQIEYLEFLNGGRAARFFETFVRSYGGHRIDAGFGPFSEYLHKQIQALMGTAPTYFVSKDMTDMITMAAESVPCDGLSPASLLTPEGFLWFHHPIDIVGPAGTPEDDDPVLDKGLLGGNNGTVSATENVGIRAIAWRHTEAIMSQGQVRPGVSYYLFHDPEHLAAAALRNEAEQIEQRLIAHGMELPKPMVLDVPGDLQREVLRQVKASFGCITLYDFSGWTYGRPWEAVPYDEPARPDDDVQGVHPVVDQARRLLLATWTMLNQKIVEIGSEHPPRAMRRRANRLMPETGDVVVIRLRKEYHPEGSEEQALANQADESAEPWFNHRFLVRGHWRRQPYGDGSTSLIWIAPYIKGPDDRPLVIKSRIYSLEH